MAAGLERAVRQGRHARTGRSAAIPCAREEVLLATPALLELADLLRDRRQPVPAEVIEGINEMLTSPESALHMPRRDGELRDWVYAVLDEVGRAHAGV